MQKGFDDFGLAPKQTKHFHHCLREKCPRETRRSRCGTVEPHNNKCKKKSILFVTGEFFLLLLQIQANPFTTDPRVPVVAAVAVRKKVLSIGHFSPSFCLQSLQSFLFVRSNQEQFYVLIALKIREK